MIFSILTLIALLLHNVKGEENADDWGYEGFGRLDPQHWYLGYKQCSGTRQSPVAISTHDAVWDKNLTFFQLHGYPSVIHGISVFKDGHTVKMNMPNGYVASLYSDSLSKFSYILKQFHFHWGKDDSYGSEHVIDGFHEPLEIHFVHNINHTEKHPINASSEEQLVVVLAILGQLSKKDNPALEPIIELIANMAENETRILNSFILDSLLPEKSMKNYFRYSGSYTTPPCNEIVEWIILDNYFYVSHAQMEKFRTIKQNLHFRIQNATKTLSEDLTINERPLQSLEGRKIYFRKFVNKTEG